MFETNRKRFYRKLEEKEKYEYEYPLNKEEIYDFWKNLWEGKNKTIIKEECIEDIAINTGIDYEISFDEEIGIKIIKNLPDWKSPGPDGIYNFFIKR